MSEPRRTVVLLSGGLDSSVLLFSLAEESKTVLALTVDYGQRHSQELEAANRIAAAAGVQHVRCYFMEALEEVFASAPSSLVGRMVEVPEGHYAAPEMAATIVPNRNMLLLAIAGVFAVSEGADSVAYAAHAGDHAVYPDCRPEFVRAVAATLQFGCGVELLSPFSQMSKAELVLLGDRLQLPFEKTYSCYRGGLLHCGRCGTCVERREAFSLAAVADPTEYEDKTDFWKTAVAAQPQEGGR